MDNNIIEFNPEEIKLEIISKVSISNYKFANVLRKELTIISAEYPDLENHLLRKLIEFLNYQGKDLKYAIDSLIRKIEDIFEEELVFYRTGKYSSTSFDEVNYNVYNNPLVMEYHTIGLIMLEILSLVNYRKFQFFIDNLLGAKNNIHKYLEIGGGHGLYAWQAEKILPNDAVIDLVDISETAINIAKIFLGGIQVNYYHTNIFSFNSTDKYDFISMCEVLEHLENPVELLIKAKELLNPAGRIFLSVPINNPAIDHIYLFETTEQIRLLLIQNGFSILNEKIIPFQNVNLSDAINKKLAIDFIALLKLAD